MVELLVSGLVMGCLGLGGGYLLSRRRQEAGFAPSADGGDLSRARESEAVGRRAMAAGQPDEAARHLGFAVQRYEELSALDELVRSAIMLANLEGARGDHARAMEVLHRCVGPVRRSGRDDLRCRLMTQKGKLMAARGNLTLAVKYFQGAADLYTQLPGTDPLDMPGLELAFDASCQLIEELRSRARELQRAGEPMAARQRLLEALELSRSAFFVRTSRALSPGALSQISDGLRQHLLVTQRDLEASQESGGGQPLRNHQSVSDSEGVRSPQDDMAVLGACADDDVDLYGSDVEIDQRLYGDEIFAALPMVN